MLTRLPAPRQVETPTATNGQAILDPESIAELGTDQPDPGRRARLRFGVGTVFDVGQTDGVVLPTVEASLLTGEDSTNLYLRLECVAREDELRVERDGPGLDRPETMGYYVPGKRLIVVREAAQLQMTKALAHELAHLTKIWSSDTQKNICPLDMIPEFCFTG